MPRIQIGGFYNKLERPPQQSTGGDIWKIAPISLCWNIWRERNDRSFEDCKRTMDELKSFFFITLLLLTMAMDFNGLCI